MAQTQHHERMGNEGSPDLSDSNNLNDPNN